MIHGSSLQNQYKIKRGILNENQGIEAFILISSRHWKQTRLEKASYFNSDNVYVFKEHIVTPFLIFLNGPFPCPCRDSNFLFANQQEVGEHDPVPSTRGSSSQECKPLLHAGIPGIFRFLLYIEPNCVRMSLDCNNNNRICVCIYLHLRYEGDGGVNVADGNKQEFEENYDDGDDNEANSADDDRDKYEEEKSGDVGTSAEEEKEENLNVCYICYSAVVSCAFSHLLQLVTYLRAR